MASFDIVSKFDMQEIDNSVNIATRDIVNRYDLKGSNAKIELNKNEKHITLEADNEFQLDAVKDILEKRIVNRKISLKVLDYGKSEKAAGMMIRQKVLLKEGISKDYAKKINKMIKNLKLKVQSQVQDQQIRVSGKKIDELQKVIQYLKGEKLEIPVQFINMK